MIINIVNLIFKFPKILFNIYIRLILFNNFFIEINEARFKANTNIAKII